MTMKRMKLCYEILMGLLAVESVIGIWVDNPTLDIVDNIVLGIFVIDFAYHFFKAESKWQYIKTHPFDLIAIIPFNSIFRMARFARFARLAKLFRIIRLLAFLNRTPLYRILKTNGLEKVIGFTVVLIFASAVPVSMVEPNVHSYEDALWWAIVTATTVGYGDISPSTLVGRLIAFVLMISGIGLISMITGAVATFFTGKEQQEKQESTTATFIKNELSRVEELTQKDIDTLIVLLERIKEEKSGEKG